MRLQSGYLLHREGRWTAHGGLTMPPSRTSWVVLEQTSLATVRLRFYNSRDEVADCSPLPLATLEKLPFRTVDLGVDDVACALTRSKGSKFRILRTVVVDERVEHVVEEFEPLSPATPAASQWADGICRTLRKQSNGSSAFPSERKSTEILQPAATSTPRAKKSITQLPRHHQRQPSSESIQNEVFSSKSSDISNIAYESDFSMAFQNRVTHQQSNGGTSISQNHRSSTLAESGVASSGSTSANETVNVNNLMELVQNQKAQIAKLERLMGATTTSSQNSSGNGGSEPSQYEDSEGDLSHGEVEIFRFQEMVVRCRSRLGVVSEKAAISAAEKFRWRQAYVQSIIGAMKIVVLEQRSVEKLELGLSCPDLHTANVQALLSEAELPSLAQLANDGRYIDEYGFIHKFTSSDPNSACVINFAAGLLMDHFSAQASYSTENEMFWKIHIDMNKPLSEATLDSALQHRRYVPDRLRPDIWRLLLQPDIMAFKSKHRTDYYSLLARTAGFFGDLEADSSFLDSALTLLTGSGSQLLSSEDSLNSSSLEDSTAASNVVRRQILVDIRRTLPNNIHFGREGRGLTSLYRVLVSFARHKPQVGYCQGINFIAAVLLLLLENEEEVFWALVVLTDNDRFFGSRQFDSRLTGVRADQKLIVKLLSKHLPVLYTHIEKNGTDLSTCFIPWLMCGFYDCVPFRTLLRIWDYFFMAGYSVFYRVAIALMKVQEQSLLEITDATLILKHIKLFPHLCHDFTLLLKVAFEDLQTHEPWPSWEDLLIQRKKNIKAIEKQDVAASLALRRRHTPSRTFSSIANANMSNTAPTFVTVVESDRCPNGASSRLFVWVDDPVTASSLFYVIKAEKQPSVLDNSDVLSTTTMPGFPTNEAPICPTANVLTRLSSQLVITFTQFRHNQALISTAQSASLICIDLDTGAVVYSFMPSSATEDDLYAATAYDIVNDVIYVVSQFGTVLVLSCSELAAVRQIGENKIEPQLVKTSAFRVLTASPVTCATVLSFEDSGILLVGASSFIFRLGLNNSIAERTPKDAVKIHIPLTRPVSDSDIKGDGSNEISFVRQIVSAQTNVSTDRDMLFWWALCDGSPCLLLYAMHKTNPSHCQILTTLSGTSCAPMIPHVSYRWSGLMPTAKNTPQPNCILLLPKPVGTTICEDVANKGSEGLLVGWPNGSVFQWQIDVAGLNKMLAAVSLSSEDGSIRRDEALPCDCGCTILPSTSVFPVAPKSFHVELTFQRQAPFTVGLEVENESGKNILTAVRKVLASTFLPSFTNKNKTAPNKTAIAASIPVTAASRLNSNPQSRRLPTRNNSLLYAKRSSSSAKEGDGQSSRYGSQNNLTDIATPLSTTFSPNSTPSHATSETPPPSAVGTPSKDCKFNNCFKLVSVSNVFRADCPVNWMAVTQTPDLERFIWAFQLEWSINKDLGALSQVVGVLATGDEFFNKNESDKKTDAHTYTPKMTRQLADHFFSPQQRSDGWKTVHVAVKIPDQK